MDSDLEPELPVEPNRGCACGCLVALLSAFLLLPSLYVAIELARLLWP